MTLKNGYIQIYTGSGKGKTTAALGLALRGAGAGLKAYMGQFLKSAEYSEHEYLVQHTGLIDVETYGSGSFIEGHPSEEDKRLAEIGLNRAERAMTSGDYDIVILDELNVAVHIGLLSVESVLELMEKRPPKVELVITGRFAPKEMTDRADLVTEMREIKHYFSSGVSARDGIEK
ncbi:cob(I)yrinic acid a,c-diamide adenosyltransferase [Limisalsivibrio acetivorans]|uniref:cob(I)yrinic acid a,c-diamide adenosyltransferase n=1 Tax=Limisalsivibrio acetivorans TaxID=1304888 RepID=UPI0003B756AE|nr:cob(I)yrinic acid a,c-diamide adenosyltransferase [Limisalsivibrio acetivorans]